MLRGLVSVGTLLALAAAANPPRQGPAPAADLKPVTVAVSRSATPTLGLLVAAVRTVVLAALPMLKFRTEEVLVLKLVSPG